MTYSDLQNSLDEIDMIARARQEEARAVRAEMPAMEVLVYAQALFAVANGHACPRYFA
jgi:hypothetical protein